MLRINEKSWWMTVTQKERPAGEVSVGSHITDDNAFYSARGFSAFAGRRKEATPVVVANHGRSLVAFSGSSQAENSQASTKNGCWGSAGSSGALTVTGKSAAYV